MYKIAVLASTNGTDLQAIIDEMEAGKMPGISLECVISNKEKCGALEKARKHSVPDYFIDPSGKSREEFDQEVISILEEKQIDLIVLVGYMKFLTDPFVEKYRNKIINVHPSLIPKYCGKNFINKSVHQAVIDAGETETGMTIHYVDESLDMGDIILQKTCPVLPTDTADTLKDRVQALEKQWYPEVIRKLSEVDNNL